eukprot:1763913-Rhodomonas_salina.5
MACWCKPNSAVGIGLEDEWGRKDQDYSPEVRIRMLCAPAEQRPAMTLRELKQELEGAVHFAWQKEEKFDSEMAR